MIVDSHLAGRTFAGAEPREVTAAAVAAFAAAVGSRWSDGDPAPPTFPIVIAFAAIQDLLADPEVGIELRHVVHGDQRFTYERPVVVGDHLSVRLTVDSVRRIGGADLITTSSALTDPDGALVCTARATLVHSAPEAPEAPE